MFVVLDLGRRRLRHVNATEHPTQDWAAQQIVEAFPGEVSRRYLPRDRDGVYGPVFRRHLLRLLRQYVAYYNGKRTHLSLNKDSPDGRAVHGPKRGRNIVEIPHLGGLHHHYERRAA